MPDGILHLFARRSWIEIVTDVADILIVTVIIYRALLVVRGTRALQVGTGLGVVFLVYLLARWAGLATLFTVLSSLLSSIILIVVVVFQNDIRRGLMRVGANAFFLKLARQQETKVVDEVVAAATELARHRMGALICFEQGASLDEFVVDQGVELNANVNRDMLITLFIPESVNKLHDGAVIIRNLRVAKAGVFFPMPTRPLDNALGSRHRAAVGITEETDAVVVVVSEERGTMSLCFNGNIVTNLDGASLRQALLELFGELPRGTAPRKAQGHAPGHVRASRASVVPPLVADREARERKTMAPPKLAPGAKVARPMTPARPAESLIPRPPKGPEGEG
jgi:uncharacterized protein (TIGR00159 family)